MVVKEFEWSLAIKPKELRRAGPTTETGMVEILLKEKLRLEGVTKAVEEIVIHEKSMVFANHLNFFIRPPMLEQNISDMLTMMEVDYIVREEFKTRITGFVREEARRVASEGPRMFCIEVNIEVIDIQVIDIQVNDAKEEGKQEDHDDDE